MVTPIISTMVEGDKKAVVRYITESKEFIVQFYIAGNWQINADYYTDSQTDALMTCHKFCNTQYYKDLMYQQERTKFFAPLDEIIEAIENFEGIAGLTYTELLSMINQSVELKAAVNAEWFHLRTNCFIY